MSGGAIVYARASTEELDADALALAAQHDVAIAAVSERGWRLHASALDRRVDGSVIPYKRPALRQALGDLVAGLQPVRLDPAEPRTVGAVRVTNPRDGER